MNCNDKIRHTCPPSSPYAACVKTEVVRPSFSTLSSSCNSVQDVELDLYTLIGNIKSELNLTAITSECQTLPTTKTVFTLIDFLLEGYCTQKAQIDALIAQNTLQPDTTVPVITLIGSNPQSLTIGSAYAELGATATDLQDGNISSEIVINSSSVNVGAVGSYSVTYNVSNSNGKSAVQVTRIVNVVAVVVPPLPAPKVYYGQITSGTSINQALVDLITPDNTAYVATSIRAFRQEIPTGITSSYSLFWDGNSPNADKNTQFIAIPSSSHLLNSVNSDAFGGENYHTNGGATVYSSSTAVLNGVNYTVYKYTSIAPSNSNLTISITNN